MDMLQWNETDLMACLEVFPTIHEQDMCHEFSVEHNKLRLSILVYQYEGEVVIRLYQMGIPDALFELPMRRCLMINYIAPTDSSADYLEFVTGYRALGGTMEATGVRVRTKPHIRIEVL